MSLGNRGRNRGRKTRSEKRKARDQGLADEVKEKGRGQAALSLTTYLPTRQSEGDGQGSHEPRGPRERTDLVPSSKGISQERVSVLH